MKKMACIFLYLSILICFYECAFAKQYTIFLFSATNNQIGKLVDNYKSNSIINDNDTLIIAGGEVINDFNFRSIFQDTCKYTVLLDNIIFKGNYIVNNMQFKGDLIIHKCNFEKNISIENCRFRSLAVLKSKIYGTFRMENTEASNHFAIEENTFKNLVRLEKLDLNSFNLFKSVFEGDVFWIVVFTEGSVRLDSTRFKKKIDFNRVYFKDLVWAHYSRYNNLSFRNVDFHYKADFFQIEAQILQMSEVTFKDRCNLKGAIIYKELSIKECFFEKLLVKS